MFNAISTSGSGLQASHTWLDVISTNIANVNDTAPTDGQVFRTHYVDLAANADGPDGVGTGVHIESFGQDQKNGEIVNDPSNPMADADGNIRRTDVNLSEQMGDMIMAQRGFQANAANIGRAKDAYEAAINIGKGI